MPRSHVPIGSDVELGEFIDQEAGGGSGGIPNPITSAVTIAPTETDATPLGVTGPADLSASLSFLWNQNGYGVEVLPNGAVVIGPEDDGAHPSLTVFTPGGGSPGVSVRPGDDNAARMLAVSTSGGSTVVECLQGNVAEGNAPKIGFLGAAGIVRPVLPGSPTLDDLITALVSLGLVALP